jgi:aspartate kinase
VGQKTETIVCKFGGTSLANTENIKKVCEIIASDPRRRIIVVSAPGKRTKTDTKITDRLIEIYNLQKSGQNFEKPFREFAERFYEIERAFGLETDLKTVMGEFHDELVGRDLDFITSTGEYFMAKILAAILGFRFVDLDKTQIIVFDRNGRVDLQTAAERFAPFKNDRIVIPGFYGVTTTGTVKTFPRGGSDITGAIIANLADAAEYENWTDVDGIYDRDPNRFADAVRFETLTYDAVEKLARAGANVLHYDCVKFVRAKKIPIHLRNTFNPSATGTIVK